MHAKVWPNVIIGSFSLKSANFIQNCPIFAQNVLIYENDTYFVWNGIDIVFAVLWKH